MILFKEIPLSFEGADYQIRVLYTKELVNVVAFRGSYPANGFRHQIQVSKKLAVEQLLEREVVDELVEVCREDIIQRRWERLLGGGREH